MDTTAVFQAWLNRAAEYSPDYYAHYGPDETSKSIRQVLDSLVEPEASVLELGCGSGRHLFHLHEHGYRNLAGIEINERAFDVMEATYPELAASGTFYFDSIEQVITGFDDGHFDAVYSVETLQHIHHDHEWVFTEVARITGDVMVTAEIEDDDEGRPPSADPVVTYVDDGFPLYYRDWKKVFTELGLIEVGSKAIHRETLRVFRSTRR